MLNEIMLRVDGRALPDFFVDELAVPLQLSALRFGLAGRDIGSLAITYWLGSEKVNVAGINVAEYFEMQNSERFLEARNPATSLAFFCEFLVNGGRTPAAWASTASFVDLRLAANVLVRLPAPFLMEHTIWSTLG